MWINYITYFLGGGSTYQRNGSKLSICRVGGEGIGDTCLCLDFQRNDFYLSFIGVGEEVKRSKRFDSSTPLPSSSRSNSYRSKRNKEGKTFFA